jgi:hypothetical protein
LDLHWWTKLLTENQNPDCMERMKTQTIGLTLAICFLAGAGCFAAEPQMGTWELNKAKSKPTPKRDPAKTQELLQLIRGMPTLTVLQEGVVAGTPQVTESGGVSTTTTHFDAVVTVTELAAFNPNIGVIFPGALVQGNSLAAGTLAGINVERAPQTLLLSTLGTPVGAGKTLTVSQRVESPTASTVEQARTDLLAKGAVVPAKASQVIKQFYSLDHAMTQIGASANFLSGGIRAQLDSDKFNTQSNIMVEFAQEYYTLAAEPPSSPVSVFGPTVDVAAVAPYTGPGNPITYIQSVTYGRLGLLLASSSESVDTLRRSIEAAVRWATGSADARYGDTEQRVLRESEVKLLLLGGNQAGAIRLVPTTQEALASMKDWIEYSMQPHDIQLGRPITYRVNYLKDNQIAKLSFTTSYQRVQSTALPAFARWHLHLQTTDKSKDGDTAVSVKVLDAANNVVAHYDQNGEKEYNNGVGDDIDLTIDRTLYCKDGAGVKVVFHIEPNGSNTWAFTYDLTGTCASGNKVISGAMTLSDEHKEEVRQ